MAIEYSMKVSQALAQPELESALEAVGMARSDDDASAWIGDGLTAVVGGSVDRFNRYGDAFGFSPASDILFSIAKDDAYERGMATMLDAVAAVLQAVSGDAVLMADHATALLLRRHGSVTLTTRDDWWTSTRPAFVDRIGLPHRFEALPVI